MKNTVLISCLLLLQNTAHGADGQVQERCVEDEIPAHDPRIEGRLRWYAKCFPQDIERKSFGNTLQEKKDNWLREKLYYMGNPTNGKRNVIYFPVFTNAAGQVWVSPYDESAPCTVPTGYAHTIDCESGCYSRGMRLLFEEGYIPIEEALESQQRIITLSSSAQRDRLDFQLKPVKSFTADKRPSQRLMVRLETRRGGLLILTHNHPILTADGYMRTAEELTTTMALVGEDGIEDPIIALDKKYPYHGKVYNVRPDVEEHSLLENIVVAEGFLSGSAWYQNEGLQQINRRLLRERPLNWLRE